MNNQPVGAMEITKPVIEVYGLLHLQEGEQSAMNARVDNFTQQIELYKCNARTLGRSLASQGIPFTLLTNNAQAIGYIDPTVKVEEIPFTTQVPKGIRFYSSHFKIDVFAYFSSLDESKYVALCDLDVVCINPIPKALLHLVSRKIPICYDISDQLISVYGSEVFIRDLSAIAELPSEGRWSGGEFIAGKPSFFKLLTYEISHIFPIYLSYINSCHHIGDEPITSGAIERLRSQGTYIADGGTLGIISRYWSVSVMHPQKPFAWSEKSFLVHLPADKHFLAQVSESDCIGTSRFIEVYKKQVVDKRGFKSFLIKLKKKVKAILKSF